MECRRSLAVPSENGGPDTRVTRGRGIIADARVNILRLGWTAALADSFAPFAAEGYMPGRVALEHTHIYRVITEEGESLARVSGRLRHQASTRADFPAVGDWVAVQPPEHSGDSRIVAVLPRRSRFSRRAAGDPTEEQVVAANID